MTGSDAPEAALTGSDVTEVCSAHALTIVVVQNVPLRMTGSSMATGCEGFPPVFRVFSDIFEVFRYVV